MNALWILDTDGKPLIAVRSFLHQAWSALTLDLMLLPLRVEPEGEWKTELISEPAELSRANPFTPIMSENIAARIPAVLDANPEARIGVLMRPCEIRALRSISANQVIDLNRLVVISADCLGTYPRDDYSWRGERAQPVGNLDGEVLRFSRQGGVAEYRFRLACQLCEDPIPAGVDISIHTVGLPVRKYMLIRTSKTIQFQSQSELRLVTDADTPLIEKNKSISEKIRFRHHQTNARLTEALTRDTGLNLESLLEQLNTCGECTICMDVCPICTANNYSRDQVGQLSRETLAEWMISCAGCGMCEQDCSQHKPLSAIFGIVQEQLAAMNS